MARYKSQDRNSLLLPVVLSEQLVSSSFAFALDYLVDNELDLTAMDAQFKNDEVGVSAYNPRAMLKIVLLAYSHGLISSRSIEQACQRNDTQPRLKPQRAGTEDGYSVTQRCSWEFFWHIQENKH